MKVLDLKCAHQHVFEGWFASEDNFQSQLARGLVECPMCGDVSISKQLSAPRLNLGATPPLKMPPSSASSASAAGGQGVPSSTELVPVQAAPTEISPHDRQALQDMQGDWLKMVRQVMANTEDVGSHFAEVARQMHYGEADERSIRGQTSREEAVALLEEGISVMPLPMPAALKETLQSAPEDESRAPAGIAERARLLQHAFLRCRWPSSGRSSAQVVNCSSASRA